MSYKYDVSIIIVNYNGRKYLYNLFESLVRLEHKDFTFEVVFVDNNSSDDSIRYIEENNWKQRTNLTIVQNNENQGFAKGNNTGVANSNGEYIVFLNNDTAVEPKWLDYLYKEITTHSEYGMVASKLLFFYDYIRIKFSTLDKILLQSRVHINGKEYQIENKFCRNLLYDETITCFGHTEIAIPVLTRKEDCIFSFYFEKFDPVNDHIELCGKRVPIESNSMDVIVSEKDISVYKYRIIQNAGSDVNSNYDGFDIAMGEVDGEDYEKEKQLKAGCGASIILKKEDFIAIGQFDERFFMYYEDTDLSFRMRKCGKRIMFCPKSIVRHIHTGSSKEWSPFFSYHVYRNKLMFIYKDISKLVFWKYAVWQFLSSVKNRDYIKRIATVDAIKILYFSADLCYESHME